MAEGAMPSLAATHTLKDVQEFCVKGEELRRKASGSYNVILIYKNGMAIRISKTAASPRRDARTAGIWTSANEKGFTPRIHWHGFVFINQFIRPSNLPEFQLPRDLIERRRPHYIIVMKAYDTSLHDYFSDKIGQEDWAALEHAAFQIVKRTEFFTDELKIGCMDTKPDNMVIRTLPSGLVDIKLIDLDEDLCKPTVSLNGAFMLSVFMLALHCLRNFRVNLFLPFMERSVGNLSSEAYTKLKDDMEVTFRKQVGAKKQIKHYFELTKFEDFFFLATRPWPFRDSLTCPDRYTRPLENSRQSWLRTCKLVSKWGGKKKCIPPSNEVYSPPPKSPETRRPRTPESARLLRPPESARLLRPPESVRLLRPPESARRPRPPESARRPRPPESAHPARDDTWALYRSSIVPQTHAQVRAS